MYLYRDDLYKLLWNYIRQGALGPSISFATDYHQQVTVSDMSKLAYSDCTRYIFPSIKLSDLQLNEEQITLLDSYIYQLIADRQFDSILRYNFIRTEHQRQMLKTLLISYVGYYNHYLLEQEYRDMVQITDEELNIHLDNLCWSKSSIEMIWSNIPEKINERHKQLMYLYYYDNHQHAIELINTNVPEEFVRSLFSRLSFNEDDYFYMFKLLAKNDNQYIEQYADLRSDVFKKLLQSTIGLNQYQSMWSFLLDSEKDCLFQKFQNEFNTNSFKTFFFLCIDFKQQITPSIKALLIKKLHAKSRYDYLTRALSTIPFDEEEKAILNSLKSLHFLKG